MMKQRDDIPDAVVKRLRRMQRDLTHFRQPGTVYREMDGRFWLERAEAEVKHLA